MIFPLSMELMKSMVNQWPWIKTWVNAVNPLVNGPWNIMEPWNDVALRPMSGHHSEWLAWPPHHPNLSETDAASNVVFLRSLIHIAHYKYSLVKVSKKLWQDPPCFHGSASYFYGHVQ